jgi:hypothetical protein
MSQFRIIADFDGAVDRLALLGGFERNAVLVAVVGIAVPKTIATQEDTIYSAL